MKMDEISLLLWKQLKGELSAAEASQLDAWLAQSPENQREAARIRQIWEHTNGSEKAFANLDLDAEFAQLQTKIRAERPTAKIVPMWPRQLLRAAAAVAVLVVAVWGFQKLTQSPVQPAEIAAFAEPGQLREIGLPDGSRVWLRGGSQLDYPVLFAENERVVRLSGEAFFQVAHNPAQPFRVKMPDGTAVQVLGTEFNIRSKGDEAATEVFVKSGKVRVENADKKVVLVANQRSIFDRKTGRLDASAAETANDLAWQTGGLSFVKTPVSQVLNDFEKYYEVKIGLENAAMQNCPYTAPLVNAPVEQSLAALAVAFRFRLEKISDKEFLLRGGVCK